MYFLDAQCFEVLALFCVFRANADIAQVRAKARQEQAAYQASLRKEQMKVDSLERTLEQKVSSNDSFPPSNGITTRERIIQYRNLCDRTKRSRSWRRSVMSWSLKWGRVSDCTARRPHFKMRKNYLMSKAHQVCLPKDRIGLRYFSCWRCVQRSHRHGVLITPLYISDVSVGGFCLKVFNIISLMKRVWVRVWEKNIVKLSIMMLLPWQPLREKTVYLLLLLSPRRVRESHRCRYSANITVTYCMWQEDCRGDVWICCRKTVPAHFW